MAGVVLYDCTLRDGAQREGISFSLEDKLRIAGKLDQIGIDYIEGGFPGSNPKDKDFFARVGSLGLSHAKISAFGYTRRPNTAVPDDNMRALVETGALVVALVGKAWTLHVARVLRTTPEENLAMVRDSVSYLKSQGKEIIFDAEHFFDGFRDDVRYAMRTLEVAQEAGADCLVLCDTNGGTLTSDIVAIVRHVNSSINTPLGIHTHNDADMAVANALTAVQQGITHVQGTINGYGERTGNANLCSIIPGLKLKMGIDCVTDAQLAQLTEASRYVSEIANLAHDPHLPYVGDSSFAHKGGLHADAVMKEPRSFEHIPPEKVGNVRRILISELSGKSSVLYKAQQFGVTLEAKSPELREMVNRVKELESQGFQFEGAEASFELLVYRSQPDYRPPFELLDFLVLVERRRRAEMMSEATVKIKVGDQVMHTADVGNGPVNALDGATRKALLRFYPGLAQVKLIDYKVRVLDENQGTGATVRVLIESGDGTHNWNTVGSSTNIIEASWIALADSLEYPLLKGWAR